MGQHGRVPHDHPLPRAAPHRVLLARPGRRLSPLLQPAPHPQRRSRDHAGAARARAVRPASAAGGPGARGRPGARTDVRRGRMANERRSGLRLWDRLILFTAWVATCGLVYLLGFYVGKGTQIGRLGLEERVVRLPVTSAPPHEGQRPKSEGERTFYDTLVAGQAGEPRAGAPTAAAKGAATTARGD